MNIREIDSTSRATVDRIIEEQWMGPVIVTRGKAIDTSTNPGFVLVEDGDILGFITYMITASQCEITVLTILDQGRGRGIGSALIRSVVDAARAAQCRRVWLITTNDNTQAIRFYQKQGFSLAAVHINALDRSRELKPSMPMTGIDGIPLKHEFEFEMWV